MLVTLPSVTKVLRRWRGHLLRGAPAFARRKDKLLLLLCLLALFILSLLLFLLLLLLEVFPRGVGTPR